MSWWLWLIVGLGTIVGAIFVGFMMLGAIGFWEAIKADELNYICIRRRGRK